MSEEELEGIQQQFKWAVQALAQHADIQPTLFPSFVVVADDLALDFDNWWLAFDSNFGDSCTPAQRKTVAALNQLLDKMSGPDKPQIWLKNDCLNHSKWSEVRQLAKDVLTAFGLPPDVPPGGRSLYARYTGIDR